MKHLFLLVLFAGSLPYSTVAQIDPVDDLVVCGEYTLPVIKGDNLSADLKYFLDGDISGTPYYEGDIIDFSTQLYMYDCLTGFGECYFVSIVGNESKIIMPDTLVDCRLLLLPIIEGDNITSDASYYSGRNATGQRYSAGALIGQSQLLYMYDGIDNCSSQDSIYILIVPEMYMEDYRDTLHCSQYKLSSIEGINLPVSSYYVDLNSNDIYSEDDVIYSSTTLVAIADSMGCELRDTFRVSIDRLYIDALPDTTICGFLSTEDFEISSSDHNLYFRYGNGDWRSLSDGFNSSFRTDQLICFKDSLAGTDCSVEECFYATFLDENEFLDTLSRYDTINICRNRDVLLQDLPLINLSQADYYFIQEGVDFNGFFPISRLPDDEYTVYAVLEAGSECDDIDTVSVRVILHEDCNEINEYFFYRNRCDDVNYNFSSGSIYDPFGTLLYGGVFFDENFENTLDDYSTLFYEPMDTSIYWYIYANDDGLFDTVKINLVDNLLDSIDSEPTQVVGPDRLCIGDSLSISYANSPSDSIIFWTVELWRVGVTNEFIDEIISYDPLKVFYTSDSVNEINHPESEMAFNVFESNADYMIIFPRYQLFYVNNSYCSIDSSPDTVYFSTYTNTTYLLQDVLCADEEIIIENQFLI